MVRLGNKYEGGSSARYALNVATPTENHTHLNANEHNKENK